MKDENQLTRVLAKVSGRLIRVDKLFEEKGKLPYGKVKATPKEQQEAFNKLTPQDVQALVQKHGYEEVNEWFRKMQGGQ